MFKILYCKFDFDQLCASNINVQNKACGVGGASPCIAVTLSIYRLFQILRFMSSESESGRLSF